MVDGETWPTLERHFGAAKLERALKTNDAGTVLSLIPEALYTTGPTGQNLNDLFLLQLD